MNVTLSDRHKVSVIVPICNVERYLAQCLSSILRQTFGDLEVICLNDGSSDGSSAIAHSFAAQDSRVNVVDKDNEGYGATCNRGLDLATGDYVAIVEPDDYLEPGMYGNLVAFGDTFGEPVDVIRAPYGRVFEFEGGQSQRVTCAYKGRVNPPSQPFSIGDGVELLCHHPSIWSGIYRADYLRERGIRFVEVPGAGWADNPFLYETLCQTDRIAYLDKPYYDYRENGLAEAMAFASKHPLIPLARWNDCMDVVERLGVTDRRVLSAVMLRGFNYCQITERASGAATPDVAEAIDASIRRMDPDLVLSDVRISPAARRDFAERVGRPEVRIDEFGYLGHLVSEGAYRVRTNGLAFACLTVRDRLGRGRKASSK